MANRRSYKADVSFLEKISMGAVGTKRVFQDLRQQGHTPIELERGSMSFKIWKTIKIKRIRVPDILCVGCGRHVESRAKTALEISMSHSLSDPARGWDHGLEDDDLIAFVVCHRAGQGPVDWVADDLVQYVAVRELRIAQKRGLAVIARPKGAEEGFEARIAWPASIASAVGVVSHVTGERVQYRRAEDNRAITVSLSRSGLRLDPLVSEGDIVAASQVLACVAPVVRCVPCAKGTAENHYLDRLSGPSLSERYAAAKALSHFQSAEAVEVLAQKSGDVKEHIYVRLEAAAGLARQGDARGLAVIRECLAGEYLENRLEAVIVLGEVGTQVAGRALVGILGDQQQHPEIRAGAAWALGELPSRLSLDALIASFAAVDQGIRTEAARAVAKLARSFTPDIVQALHSSESSHRPGIAWALSRSAQFTVEQLLDALVDDDSRRWVAYIIGTQHQRNYAAQIEALRFEDPEVYFAVTVLWQIMSSWVYGLEEYG